MSGGSFRTQKCHLREADSIPPGAKRAKASCFFVHRHGVRWRCLDSLGLFAVTIRSDGSGTGKRDGSRRDRRRLRFFYTISIGVRKKTVCFGLKADS